MNEVGAGGEESNLTPNGSIHIPYIPCRQQVGRNSAVPHILQDGATARQWINGFALPLSSTPA